MKLQYILLAVLLLFARGCDFYSTSLWIFEEDGLAHETNPLTRIFGLGWNGLVIVNIFIVGLILLAYYYYCFRYRLPDHLNPAPTNFREYASILYYDKPRKFHQIFYRLPFHKKPAVAHLGFVLIRVLIIASLLATVHNLGQYYQWDVYAQFREIVGRPLYVIYSLILLAFILTYWRLLQGEFRRYQLS